jgi:NADH:ubiquinone oxidoreductase subunit 2 (subunit N)
MAGALLAIVALYYYLQIVRVMYMSEPKNPDSIPVKRTLAAGVLVCLLGVVGYGAYPKPLLESARIAAAAFMQTQPAVAASRNQ